MARKNVDALMQVTDKSVWKILDTRRRELRQDMPVGGVPAVYRVQTLVA